MFGSKLRRTNWKRLKRLKVLRSQLDDKQRITRAKERIGRLLEQLSDYEREAYDGSNGTQYDTLLRKLEQVKSDIKTISIECLDSSFESRFLAVNVHDTKLNDATRMHFTSRAQGSFWTVYQQIKGWRALLAEIVTELGR